VGGDRQADRRWLGQTGLNELPSWPGPYKVEVVGLERIISVARADNVASRRVMEKCGLVFQEEVTHRGALVVWYAIDRAGWQASQ
jgi:hypothetical protein